MSSLVKTFHNNRLYHRFAREHAIPPSHGDMRFTKILTKYSTEYSNTMFLYMLCQELDMDKKDAAAFFQEIRLLYGNGSKNGADMIYRADTLNDVERIFQDTKIKKLDIGSWREKTRTGWKTTMMKWKKKCRWKGAKIGVLYIV